MKRTPPEIFFENDKRIGKPYLWGFDEVGRGALAGPIVGCMFHFDPAVYENFNGIVYLYESIIQINDSKKLTDHKKKQFLKAIQSMLADGLCDYTLSMIEPEIIDQIGVHKANKQLVTRCMCQIDHKPDYVVIDSIGGIQDFEVRYGTETVSYLNTSKADATYACVASASIVAKCFRDLLMKNLGNEYGFLTNSGYGSAFHRKKLLELGPSKAHRQSFLGKIMASSCT